MDIEVDDMGRVELKFYIDPNCKYCLDAVNKIKNGLLEGYEGVVIQKPSINNYASHIAILDMRKV